MTPILPPLQAMKLTDTIQGWREGSPEFKQKLLMDRAPHMLGSFYSRTLHEKPSKQWLKREDGNYYTL